MKKKKEILSQKQDFHKYFKQVFAYDGKNFASEKVSNCTFANMSHDVDNGKLLYNVEYGRNLVLVGGKEGDKDIYDGMIAGSPFCSDMYGIANVGASENIYNSSIINGCSNMYYCFYCVSCSYCLGCVGLSNKSFCILNKQYTKEERYKKANEIFAQMDADGTLGSFFPGSMNPFYFNDTVAYLIDDSFTKEEVTKEGYLRRDEEIRVDIPEGADIVVTSDECRVTGEEKLLIDYQGFDDKGNREINPEILKKVICDEKGNYYKIVPMELEFLQKHGLPLPELHWLDRIKLGFKFK